MTGHGLREAEPNSDKSFIEQTKDKASEFKESARETMQDLTSQGAEKMDTLAEKTENVKESIKQNVDIAGEKIQELCEESGKKILNLGIFFKWNFCKINLATFRDEAQWRRHFNHDLDGSLSFVAIIHM